MLCGGVYEAELAVRMTKLVEDSSGLRVNKAYG
jgi:hypothetical protein